MEAGSAVQVELRELVPMAALRTGTMSLFRSMKP